MKLIHQALDSRSDPLSDLSIILLALIDFNSLKSPRISSAFSMNGISPDAAKYVLLNIKKTYGRWAVVRIAKNMNVGATIRLTYLSTLASNLISVARKQQF